MTPASLVLRTISTTEVWCDRRGAGSPAGSGAGVDHAGPWTHCWSFRNAVVKGAAVAQDELRRSRLGRSGSTARLPQIVPSERGRRRNPFRRGFRIRRERHRDPPRILVNRCCGGAILRRTTGRGGPRPWVRRRRRDFRRQRDRPDARSVGERRSCRPAPMPGPGPCVSSALEVVVPAAGPAGLPTEGPIRQRVLGLALGRRSVGPRGGLGLGRCGGKPEPIGSNPLANICTMPGILYADRQNACRSAYSVQLPRECLCLEVASGRLLAACGRSGWPSGLPRCRWLSRRRHPRRRGEGGRR